MVCQMGLSPLRHQGFYVDVLCVMITTTFTSDFLLLFEECLYVESIYNRRLSQWVAVYLWSIHKVKPSNLAWLVNELFLLFS